MNRDLLPALAAVAMEEDQRSVAPLRNYLDAVALIGKLVRHVFKLNDKIEALEERVKIQDRGLELLATNAGAKPGEVVQ